MAQISVEKTMEKIWENDNENEYGLFLISFHVVVETLVILYQNFMCLSGLSTAILEKVLYLPSHFNLGL